MTQQTINYDEEMVGANHPTKPDTLNRALLVSHAENGGFRNGDAFPVAGLEDRQVFYRTDEERLYVYRGSDTAWVPVGADDLNWLATGKTVLSGGSALTYTLVDCSAAVPAGAKEVVVEVYVDGGESWYKYCHLRKPGTDAFKAGIYSSTGGIGNLKPAVQAVVALDGSRRLEYCVPTANVSMSLKVCGYR